MKKVTFLMLMMSIFASVSSIAQHDSTHFKNTIHFNITNPMIFGGKSTIFGYERVLKHNQTITLNLGVASYPKLVNVSPDSAITAELGLQKDYKDKGFHVSAEYRFYLKKENKYPAPRGIYIGPYYSYNYFNRINNWNVNTASFQGDVQTDMTLDIQSVGFELGYQFVFWKRLSVDLILVGPGLSFYKLKCDVSTTLSKENEQQFYETINQFFKDKIPGFSKVITGDGFEKNGSIQTTSAGYRYLVTVGFRF